MISAVALMLSLATTPKQTSMADLAGRYYQGNGGINQSLDLAPDGQFSFRVHECYPLEKTRGSWRMEGSAVILAPNPLIVRRDSWLSERFQPIRWGQRLYLIEDNRLAAFAATAGKSGRLRTNDVHGSFFVRTGSGDKLPAVSGAPDLPPQYLEFYEKGPIEAKVVAVNPDRTVVLNHGTNARLRKGLMLASWGPDYEVVSVAETSAIARPWYYLGSNRGPAVGDPVTSGSEGWSPQPAGMKRYPYLVDVPGVGH